MLTFLPAILLLVTAVAVFFLRFLPRGTGYAWLTAVILTFLTWGAVLASRWFVPPELLIPAWRPFDPGLADSIQFNWNSISWLYSFALVSLCLAVLATSGTRLETASNPLSWAANLGVTAAGLVAVLAETPLAMVLSWVALDVIDLSIVVRLSRGWKYAARGITVFIMRMLSIFLMTGALVVQRFIGIPLEFDTMSSLASLFVLLSLGIRLGLLPLNLPYTRGFPYQRELLTNLRITAHVVGLAALARIPQISIPGNWLPTLYAVTLLVSLYGAARWITAPDELSGRPYWLLTLSGLAFISVLQGHIEQSAAWGLAMVVSGGVLFLFSARSKGLRFLPALGLIALTGLPFTPASSGWEGLVSPPVHLGDAAGVAILAMLLFGYVKHALKPGDDMSGFEGWVKGFYPTGLVLLLASGWLAAGFGLSHGLGIGLWWPSLAAVFLSAALVWVSIQMRKAPLLTVPPRLSSLVKNGWKWISPVFSLNWFFELLWAIYRALRRLVHFFTLLFEGEGGLLWAFLLLALMLTLLIAEAGI